MKLRLVAPLLCLAAACEAGPVSDIKADEHVVFFRTAAWLGAESTHWQVPIHGWIYEPEDSTARKAVFETILNESFDLQVTDEAEPIFSERINLLELRLKLRVVFPIDVRNPGVNTWIPDLPNLVIKLLHLVRILFHFCFGLCQRRNSQAIPNLDELSAAAL